MQEVGGGGGGRVGGGRREEEAEEEVRMRTYGSFVSWMGQICTFWVLRDVTNIAWTHVHFYELFFLGIYDLLILRSGLWAINLVC
jgi:hypothetical protein